MNDLETILQFMTSGLPMHSPEIKTKPVPNDYLPGIKEFSAHLPTAYGAVLRPHYNRGSDTMVIDKSLHRDKEKRQLVQNHELDHLLNHRASPGAGPQIYNLLVDPMNFKARLADLLVRRKEDIEKKFPAWRGSDYLFDPKNAQFGEIFSDLQAIQDTYKVDLTKDEIFKELFTDKKDVEGFNAASGYRRTRFDKHDLPPYTIDKWKDKPLKSRGMMDALLDMIKGK